MSSRNTLSILQYNVRKSRDTVMATLLRDPRVREYDIVAIQEPWRNPFMSTTHHPAKDHFHLCYPADSEDGPARVCSSLTNDSVQQRGNSSHIQKMHAHSTSNTKQVPRYQDTCTYTASTMLVEQRRIVRVSSL